MKRYFECKYNIGEEVYYITPDSDKGVIIDINYSVRHQEVQYKIVFGRQDSDCVWCVEDEITKTKIF